MELEKRRGISVTSSVMQFQYNVASSTGPIPRSRGLLRTATEWLVDGFFSGARDTRRTLTAVDSAPGMTGDLACLAPAHVNLQLTLERWPHIRFRDIRERT